jgi:hypothetical protein
MRSPVDLATMRTRTKTLLGDTAGALSDAALEEHLNRVYRFEIPDQVPGAAREGSLTFSLTTSEDTYDLDTHASLKGKVMAPRRGVRVDGDLVEWHTDPTRFWACFDLDDTAEGTPTAVLAYGRELVFRPIPSAALSVYLPCAKYRDALTSTGLEYDPEALACVAGAAFQIAADRGQAEVARDALALYTSRIAELRTRSLAQAVAYPTRASW